MSEVANKIELPVNLEEHKRFSTRFQDWFVNAKARDIHIYYRGKSLHDTLAGSYVQITTFKYAVEGRVYLYCMRDPEDKDFWLFMAEKASKRIHRLNPKPLER